MLNEDAESLFKSWVTEYGGAVLKVARAYTLTTEDCQDLVQEILLLYLDDLSYRQMAEVLGISESNVGVKLNREKGARQTDE